MKSEPMKNSNTIVAKRRARTMLPLAMATGFFTAGLLLFGAQGSSAQETSVATETTVVTNSVLATDTTLVAGEVVVADSSQAAVADDSTPAGSLETGFGGTASGSKSNRSGLFVAAAGITMLGALGLRRAAKRSSFDTDRRQ